MLTRVRGSLIAGLAAALLAACGGSSPHTGDSGVGNGDGGQGNDGGKSGDGGGGGSDGGLAVYCNTGGSATCQGTLSCLSFGSTGGFCSQTCALDAGNTCPAGGACDNFGGGVTACAKGCATLSDCPPNDVCAPTNVGQLCIPDCRIHPDICGAGTVCNTSAGFCVQTGAQGYGQPCGQVDGGTARCNASLGLSCVVGQAGAMQGYCTQACGTGNPCPATPPNAQCLTATNGNVCGWTCTGPTDTTCPSGLTCQSVSGGGFLCL